MVFLVVARKFRVGSLGTVEVEAILDIVICLQRMVEPSSVDCTGQQLAQLPDSRHLCMHFHPML